MRTLALLIALLLLAFETQADPFRGTIKKLLDQEHLEDNNQDMSITFGGDESTALQYADVKARVTCFCKRPVCDSGETQIGYCRLGNTFYRLCCRQ
ncbi:neutrophil antibiotic peptide NP-1-like [Mesocricetus auratus]|nr:neutrophil antibiotic peptide NP-1-like [Mesocricetus auratus]